MAYCQVAQTVKKYVFVANQVPRNSFEYKTLDAAIHVRNSKWTMPTDVTTYRAFQKKKQPLVSVECLEDIDRLIVRLSSVERARSSDGSFLCGLSGSVMMV